ncbi:hypothetical protein DL93DRAFT_414212 [Clavulina sp. PMI_390]|nr:hypothetical protein DL93DRAFT_414212 [Clavulina sp. PMI_390]
MNVLAKGTACLQCRQHKQKCDSLKPVCSRCQRYHKKCVYTSGLAKRRLGPPLAMVLEARALELEIRIHKLNLISTHDLSLASAKLLARIGGLGKAVGLQPILTRTNPIGSPNDRQLQSQRASVNQRPRSSGRMGFSDLSPVFSLYLINAFLLSRMQFYFSIDVPNFRRCLSLPPSHPDSIHPCLLNACYLGACARTRSELSFLEPYFLRRTRHFLHRSLMYADRITHFLRASLILGCYFVRKRRLNEFFTILDATSDLALACGLGAPGGTNGPDPAQYLLPRPKDVAEVIDRIQLAQSVYLLGQIAPIVGGSPPSFPYDNRWAMTSKDAALQYQYGEGFVLEEGCLSELWRSDGHLKVSLVRMSEKIMRFAQHSHEKGYGGFDEDYNFLRAQMNSQYSKMPPLRRASRTHSQKPAESFDLNISLVSVAITMRDHPRVQTPSQGTTCLSGCGTRDECYPSCCS